MPRNSELSSELINIQNQIIFNLRNLPEDSRSIVLENVTNTFSVRKHSKLIFDSMYNAVHWLLTDGTPDDALVDDLLHELPVDFRRVWAAGNFMYQVDNGGIRQWIFNKYCKEIQQIINLIADGGCEDHIKELFENEILYHLDHKAIAKWQEEKYTSESFWRKVKNLNSEEIEEIQASREELERIEIDLSKLNIDATFFENIIADLYGSDLMILSEDLKIQCGFQSWTHTHRDHVVSNLDVVAAAYIRDGLMKQD